MNCSLARFNPINRQCLNAGKQKARLSFSKDIDEVQLMFVLKLDKDIARKGLPESFNVI